MAAPMTKVIKGTKFTWTPQAQKSFEELKDKLTHAPALAHPCLRRSLKLNVMPPEWALKPC